eukprot:scaffold125845_cov18-Prasinocladus_malaysianus.AAC.1
MPSSFFALNIDRNVCFCTIDPSASPAAGDLHFVDQAIGNLEQALAVLTEKESWKGRGPAGTPGSTCAAPGSARQTMAGSQKGLSARIEIRANTGINLSNVQQRHMHK